MPDTDTKIGAAAHPLPSIFNAEPGDLGGIKARQGFAYQDHVAAGFYVQMLEQTDLVAVSCETYDDILLVWEVAGAKKIEFVQVKAEHPDQLWTIAKLCERKRSPKSPNGVGTSIPEKGLDRDRYIENTSFRVVTSRQIHSDLEVLTRTRGHEHRAISHGPFKDLVEAVGGRLSGVISKKGNGARYWLENTCWEVKQEEDISRLNRTHLSNVLHALGLSFDPDAVGGIYDNLLALAKRTAEYGVAKWKDKWISRTQLLDKLSTWSNPYPGLRKVERLEQKLIDAGLDAVGRNAAKEQQLFYLKKRRTQGYLTTEQTEDLEQEVLAKLHTLRSSLDSGDINESGVQFHNRCLNEVTGLPHDAGNGGGRIPPGYLPGCMYEITARCRHRFTRFQP